MRWQREKKIAEDIITILSSGGGEVPDDFLEFQMMAYFHTLDDSPIRRMSEAKFRRILNYMRVEREADRIRSIEPSATPPL